MRGLLGLCHGRESHLRSEEAARSERDSFNSGHLSGRAGFTLLEAVVALAIVGMSAVAVLEAFAAELRTTALASRMVEAQALAEHRLAIAELLGSTELRALPDTMSEGEFPPPMESYRWRMDASPVPGEPDLYDLALSIEWENGSYPLRTRLYRPPSPASR